jgi:hypothetical protein
MRVGLEAGGEQDNVVGDVGLSALNFAGDGEDAGVGQRADATTGFEYHLCDGEGHHIQQQVTSGGDGVALLMQVMPTLMPTWRDRLRSLETSRLAIPYKFGRERYQETA